MTIEAAKMLTDSHPFQDYMNLKIFYTAIASLNALTDIMLGASFTMLGMSTAVEADKYALSWQESIFIASRVASGAIALIYTLTSFTYRYYANELSASRKRNEDVFPDSYRKLAILELAFFIYQIVQISLIGLKLDASAIILPILQYLFLSEIAQCRENHISLTLHDYLIIVKRYSKRPKEIFDGSNFSMQKNILFIESWFCKLAIYVLVSASVVAQGGGMSWMSLLCNFIFLVAWLTKIITDYCRAKSHKPPLHSGFESVIRLFAKQLDEESGSSEQLIAVDDTLIKNSMTAASGFYTTIYALLVTLCFAGTVISLFTQSGDIVSRVAYIICSLIPIMAGYSHVAGEWLEFKAIETVKSHLLSEHAILEIEKSFTKEASSDTTNPLHAQPAS